MSACQQTRVDLHQATLYIKLFFFWPIYLTQIKFDLIIKTDSMTNQLSIQDLPGDASTNQELALIVDDEPTNRLVLSALLAQMGFRVVEAEDGFGAIDHFTAEKPDIVFMDIMMPGMDGYEATSRIKHISGDDFVPIIVLTAISDEDALAKCIACGGDDVLGKPFDARILQSKIHAMQRIRDLHRNVTDLYGQIHHEQVLAEKIFTRAVSKYNVPSDGLRTIIRPASVFSGDMVLTTYSPGGDMHILLGDFTGHGLSAAIGALPTAEIFSAMAGKGYDGHAIMSTINEKLCVVLPVEIFLSACYIYVPSDLSHISLLNCGLPEVLFVNEKDGEISKRFSSNALPLGISRSFPTNESFERFLPEKGGSLFVYSDGLIEGRNREGEEYGMQRLESSIRNSASIENTFDQIIDDISSFCQEETQHDDITLVEIPFSDRLFSQCDNPGADRPEDVWRHDEHDNEESDAYRFSLSIQGARLRYIDPLPLVMSNLKEMKLSQKVLTESYTVLAELMVNALDHGILGLQSSLKTQEDGFTLYLEERARRLEKQVGGCIDIQVQISWEKEGGSLKFIIEDSGSGFDFSAYQQQESVNPYSGRGIAMMMALCESVQYEDPGNKVEVVYKWTN